MVAPAAKREAVAHLQTTLGMSERRACRVIDADRSLTSVTSRAVPMMVLCARSCANWRINAAGSAIAGCTFCCGVRG